jgi:hypothetical protein
MHPFFYILIATVLEVTGDAILRKSIYNLMGFERFGFMIVGTILLFGYGYSLNLAPVEFKEVVGLYIATLFVVWQTVNFIIFKTTPTIPILIGGLLIVTGGLLVTFWKT